MLPARRREAHARRVPYFMDRHEFSGLTATDAANMHLTDMAPQDRFRGGKRGRLRPKGFADSVQVYEVVWQEAAHRVTPTLSG
jgi:hypothetical protein